MKLCVALQGTFRARTKSEPRARKVRYTRFLGFVGATDGHARADGGRVLSRFFFFLLLTTSVEYDILCNYRTD